ncbi:MAG: FAD-containing monooxygenase EthA [Actinomycetota bacterium]|jgi:cation diffusion facilitator CzcD-associated flavoprotein CzcO
MSQSATLEAPADSKMEHFDVLIVGAGISGVGSAVHMQEQCPERSFVILEKFESFGGTWHMHKYPGVRSDSDLYTFGYRFKPWVGAPIATSAEIKKYMGEVIEENNLAPKIRYRHRITNASWSGKDNRWTVDVTRLDTNQSFKMSCNFLYMCQGYYNQDKGYTPEWPGMDTFKGRIVHPMEWTEDITYDGKNVLVIGSGATTATVVPEFAKTAKHVTVLQRSPTYFIPGRNVDDLADTLRQLEIDEKWIHEIVRRKRLFDGKAVTEMSFNQPEELRTFLLEGVKALLPEDYDMTHFTPKYRPWQQRIAFVPDGDLFAGIKAGKATMVTDEIETFNERGVLTKGGVQIDADLIVPATGFHLSVLGDIPFSVDGKPVNWNDTVTYRGMMFTGVPNLAWIFGYFRASWTLRVDLMGDFIARMFRHMDEKGAKRVTPRLREKEDAGMPVGDWIKPDNFNPNYLMRSIHLMPKAGNKPEWMHDQDYWSEKDLLPSADLDDGCLVFE